MMGTLWRCVTQKIISKFVAFLIFLILMEGIPVNAKVVGHFQCSKPPVRAVTKCLQDDLPKVENGSFNCTGYSVGDKCNLTCDNGYYPSSTNGTFCNELHGSEGNWTPGDFTCSAVQCLKDDLPKVENGSFNCTGYSVGDKCNLTCDNGYYPSSSNGTVCNELHDSEGNWTLGNFTCSAIQCLKDDLPKVENGSFNCTGYSVGDKCNLTCDNGYYPSSSHGTVCEELDEDEGNWRPGDFTCSAIQCLDDLPKVENGSFNCTGYSVGDNCNLTCDKGYYPSSSHGTVCKELDEDEGNWTPGDFTCSAIQCLKVDLPKVENGSFNCTGYSVGDKCNLVCDNGYYPSSTIGTVCNELHDSEGNWTLGNFTCSAIQCLKDNLPKVGNGSFNCTGYSVGDKCNLTCDNGYYPSSTIATVCNELHDSEGNWTPGDFTCSEIKCSEGSLPKVTKGDFLCPTHTVEGDVCNLTCHEGFYPSQSKQAVCGAGSSNNGGEWFGGNFSCRAIDCSQWNQWSGSKYKLINIQQEWENSSQLCKSFDSDLVTIENKEENGFVHELVLSCPGSSWTWIGLSDPYKNDQWEWSDQTESSYTNWDGGQPDNRDTEDYAVMNRQSGVWHDHWLRKKFSAVCEKKH